MWDCKEGFSGCCLRLSDLKCNGYDSKGSEFDPSLGLQSFGGDVNFLAKLIGYKLLRHFVHIC